jgi:hypothetical protein
VTPWVNESNKVLALKGQHKKRIIVDLQYFILPFQGANLFIAVSQGFVPSGRHPGLACIGLSARKPVIYKNICSLA